MGENRSLAERVFPLRKGAKMRHLWLTVLLALVFGLAGVFGLVAGDRISPRGIPLWLLGALLVVGSLYYFAMAAYHYSVLKRR